MECPKTKTIRWVDDNTGEEVGSCEYVRADLAPQWQPISTAPKDGEILGYGNGEYHVVDTEITMVEDGVLKFFNGDVYVIITDWKPLTPP